jgi:POT family proton-dependent oligopeptide transporter
LWGINLAYVIEGMVYFGILGYLAMYFNNYIGLNDVWAGRMVGVLTAGITIAMFFLGTVADRKGVRFALLLAFVLMLCGRFVISTAPLADPANVQITERDAGRADPVFVLTDVKPLPAPPSEESESTEKVPEETAVPPANDGTSGNTKLTAEPPPVAESAVVPSGADAAQTQGGEAMEAPSPGLGSIACILSLIGILLVVTGYGMYQPGAYAAVRQFTTPKTAAMGFAMLYALMNLGGWIPTYAFVLRNNEFTVFGKTLPGAGFGLLGVIWIYTGCTAAALLATYLILTRKTVARAIAEAKAVREADKANKPAAEGERNTDKPAENRPDAPPAPNENVTFMNKVGHWFRNHPLADGKFSFFIFCLIPVQTLFAHNWLTLPMYVERAYRETWPWISNNFEPAVNFNPLLIFIFVPIVTALTQKAKVYNMMIIGTFVMAAPTFLLAIGPYWWTLLSYLVIMTIGEAMWQPRFLQYAAEIAPEGRTGAYMGVAQFPWFLTKVIVPLYSGYFLQNYCPEGAPAKSEIMWLIYGCIAVCSTILLLLAKPWIGKDFKTKADE